MDEIIQYIGQHAKGIAAISIAIAGYGAVLYAIYENHKSEKKVRTEIIKNIRSRGRIIRLDDIKQE